MHLLLAEDDKISRELLRRVIESEGHSAKVVTDGEEAWKLLTEGGEPFDACVFDICMPTVGGLELLERMRAADALRRIPVILCSAVNDRPTVQRAAAAGVAHYIVKPYSRTVMLDKLRQIRSQIQEQNSLESAESVCKRLGIEPQLHRDMLDGVLENTSAWVRDVRATTARAEAQKLFIRGRGLKGSCLSTGVRGAAQRIEAVEAFIQRYLDLGAESTDPFPTEQAEPLLAELEREIQSVRQRLQAAA